MKTFLQFLNEESDTPFGVLFLNDNKTVVVGSSHGNEKTKISDIIVKRILPIAKEYGLYWEGDGGDIKYFKSIFGGKENYTAGWDDLLIDRFGLPPSMLISWFGNVKENKQIENVINVDMSIFDSMLKNQIKYPVFAKNKFNSKILSQFLKDISEKNVDFLELSKQPATKENVTNFFSKGEKLTWSVKNSNASKMAKKNEDFRNDFIINNHGVFVAGAGHLPEIITRLKELGKPKPKLIGGEKAE